MKLESCTQTRSLRAYVLRTVYSWINRAGRSYRKIVGDEMQIQNNIVLHSEEHFSPLEERSDLNSDWLAHRSAMLELRIGYDALCY